MLLVGIGAFFDVDGGMRGYYAISIIKSLGVEGAYKGLREGNREGIRKGIRNSIRKGIRIIIAGSEFLKLVIEGVSWFICISRLV